MQRNSQNQSEGGDFRHLLKGLDVLATVNSARSLMIPMVMIVSMSMRGIASNAALVTTLRNYFNLVFAGMILLIRFARFLIPISLMCVMITAKHLVSGQFTSHTMIRNI